MNNEPIEKKETVTSTSQPSAKTEKVLSSSRKTLAEPLGESISEGFNLIPKMTAEEKVVEKKKSTFNIGSAVSLIALVVISIAIVGFNILSKQQLNRSKEELYNLENRINQRVDLIISNNAITDRAVLYDSVKKKSFSHKEVIDFVQSIIIKSGNIELKNIEITDLLTFAIDGNAPTLEDVSKLWYLLGINDSIETVNLKSVGKSDNGVRFSFEGKFISNKFINK